MLLELDIKNFAIIKDISIQFKNGMSVLTGETGAGKSIIIDAVGVVAGGRGSSQFVRHGEEKLSLQALFTFDPTNDRLRQTLDENGIDHDSDNLILHREIYANGRSVSRVNGTLVTITILKAIGQELVDIQGQNEHQTLMQSENHLEFLDTYGGKEITDAYKAYEASYGIYRDALKEFENTRRNEQENNQRLDMLTFQIDEIESVHLESGEETTLEEERSQLMNYQNIVSSLTRAFNLLQAEDDPAGLDFVGQTMDALEEIADLHSDYKQLNDITSEAFYQLQEVASSLSSQLNDLSFDENRLNEIEMRLDAINQLKRKYGESIDEILVYLAEAKAEYEKLSDLDSYLENVEKNLEKYAEDTLEKGRTLSKFRRDISFDLEQAVQDELQALYMGKTTFSVHFDKELSDLTMVDATHHGLDKVSFYISTNPGEPLKPLTKVASGGEMSRLMLALKTIFSNQRGITSVIFDEVDTGVSGRVAQAIADKIYTISDSSQVLCITHLPQVAAKADNHLYIDKVSDGDRTKTLVTELSTDKKIEEIARMMAGEKITESAIEAAKALKESSAS